MRAESESTEMWEYWLYVLYDAGDAFFDDPAREAEVDRHTIGCWVA